MPTAYSTTTKRVRIYYDPRGQVVRTVNPDATEQWVVFGRPEAPSSVSLNALKTPVPFAEGQNAPPASGGGGFTPWESFTYDANDLAPITHPSGSGAPASHHYTPKSSLLDPLGRTIVTIDRLTQDPMPVSMNTDGTQPPWGTGEGGVVMQYEFDIRGNLLKVTDALDRTAFTHVYDLKPKSGEGKDEKGANILRTTHIDSGTKTALFDAAHRPTELRDAKGALILHGYDGLNRPTRIWARDNGSEDVTLRQKLIYGDDTTDGPATPEATNHLGKLFEHYDEAGKVTLEAYDFKGNVLQKKREVIADSEILSVFDGPPADWEVPTYRVDWDATPTLDGEFLTDMEYDGLNRLKRLLYPEDQDSERKELLPFYNNAGALEKVTMDGDTYVEHIAYNAKGQRLLIAFGNDVMTRYAYDPSTFRLVRQRSETFTRTAWQFAGAGTVHQDTGHDYDLAGNILRIKERVTNCGVGGSNSLDRNFSYDPLYRLLAATGRENSPTITPIWDDSYRSTDHSITTAYNQNYQYDRMGNILQLQHIGNNSFTRNFSYNSATHNKLQSIAIGGDTYSFIYDANGNQIQENTDRHFEWDAADKLRSFRVQAGTGQPTKFAHYLYDAGGNRVKKLVRVSGGNYTSTTYIDGIFEHLTDGTDIQNTLHVMDDKSRIATIRLGYDFGDTTPAVKYVLEDHLGNSTRKINGDGTFISKEEYYPFGETSYASYGKKRYKYNGKERDEESGFYNYGMRYYSAWTCRFISVDPLARQYAQLSAYNYASNNPVTHLDVDGKQNPSETASPQSGNGSKTIGQSGLIQGIPDHVINGVSQDFAKFQAKQKEKSTSPMESELYKNSRAKADNTKIGTICSLPQNIGNPKPTLSVADMIKSKGTLSVSSVTNRMSRFEQGMVSSPITKGIAGGVSAALVTEIAIASKPLFTGGSLALRFGGAVGDASSQLITNNSIGQYNITSTATVFLMPQSNWAQSATSNSLKVTVADINNGTIGASTVFGGQPLEAAIEGALIDGTFGMLGGEVENKMLNSGFRGSGFGEFFTATTANMIGNNGVSIFENLRLSFITSMPQDTVK